MNVKSTQNSPLSPLNYMLILLRIVSMLMLAFSVGYWSKLIGLADADIRFDTLSTAWKIAATSLVVLQPVAALGLWGGWHWGIVLWVLVAVIEFAMYGLNPSVFGQADLLLIFHATGLATYVLIYVLSPRKRAPHHMNE